MQERVVDVVFTLPVVPRGKAAAKPAVRGKRTRIGGVNVTLNAYAGSRKDDRTREYEALLERLIRDRLPERPPGDAFQLDILAVLPRPQRLMRNRDPLGVVWAPVKPDRDNIVKAVQDAMRQVWRDDALVVVGSEAKVYAERHGRPRLVCRLTNALPDLAKPPPWLARLLDHDPLAGAGEWEDLPGGDPWSD